MAANTETKTVIVVDDEVNIVDLLVEILESADYRVIGCPIWTEAMDAIGREQPDLVLLDLKMPTIDGPSMLEFIRKEGLDVPVIVVSGFVTDQVSEDLSKLGVSAFVNKPFRAAEILEQANKAIATAKRAPKSMDVLYEGTEPDEHASPAPKPETNEVLAALKKLDGPRETEQTPSADAGTAPTAPPENEVLAALKRHDRPPAMAPPPSAMPETPQAPAPPPKPSEKAPAKTPEKAPEKPPGEKKPADEVPQAAFANDLVGSTGSSSSDADRAQSVSVTGHRHHRPPPRRKKRLTKRNILMFGSMFVICMAVAGFMAVMNWYADQVDLDALKKSTEKAITKQATNEILKQLQER